MTDVTGPDEPEVDEPVPDEPVPEESVPEGSVPEGSEVAADGADEPVDGTAVAEVAAVDPEGPDDPPTAVADVAEIDVEDALDVEHDGRITEIGAPELIDTGSHTTAAIVGGVLLVAVIIIALFGFSSLLDDAAEGREVPVVVVPRLNNRPVDQAQAQLERLGLIVDIQYQANEVVPVDVVVDQTPIAGARLEVGERVVLGVSDGPSGVRVPDTVGQTIADATRLLSVVGLTAAPVERYDEGVVAGLVLTTNPPPGSRSMIGSQVEVIVSKGPEPRVVPEIVGLGAAEGMLQIGRAELNVGEVTRRPVDGVAPGTIASVEPGVGASVPRGTRVDVVISVSVTDRTVPDLVGLRRATAEKIADSLGIDLRVTTETVAAGDRRAGLVISQTPIADSPLAAMSVVVALVPAPTTTTTTAAPRPSTTTTAP